VRALGEVPRQGAIAALRPLLQQETNQRFLDVIAVGLVHQQEAGVEVLAEELSAQRTQRNRRSAILDALAASDLPSARALVLRDLRASGGRDRLPALRALERVAGDASVDEVRVQLAHDNDLAIASAALLQLARHGHPSAPECAVDLHKRGKPLDAEAHAAVLHGLLVAPNPETFPWVLQHGAHAENPFGKAWQERWRAALANPAFAQWLVREPSLPKETPERVFLAEVLGQLGGPSVQPSLGKMLADAGEVQAAAASALARLGDADSCALLAQLLKTGSEEGRAVALTALFELQRKEPAFAEELLTQTQSTYPTVIATSLRLLAELNPPPAPAQPRALALLDHKSPAVRSAATQLLGALRQKDSIAPLIGRLDKEQGRLRSDVLDALEQLTQMAFLDTKSWTAWWQQNGAGFTVPQPKPKKSTDPKQKPSTVATYWELTITSERVAFVVDTSGSMNELVGTGGQTRLDSAKFQLDRVLPQLPPKAKCNLITFSTDAKAFSDRLIEPKRRPALLAAAKELKAQGATNVYAALKLAFEDPEVDTIYLLTDGNPSAGTIVESKALADEVQRWNRRRGIRIYTIAVGGKSDFLDRLAKDSGGDSVVAR
jgi:HEAT repeat protein